MTTNYESVNNQDYQGAPESLPNATLILVLGIVSIIACCCYGLPGIICGIITLILAKTAINLYDQFPAKYTRSSYSNVQAGKICAIIALVLSVIMVLFYIYIIVVIGWAAFSDPSVIYDFYGIEMPA